MRWALVVLAALLAGCGGGEKPSEPLPSAAAALELKSSAFSDGATIPRRYTCDGDGGSPPLSWTGVPAGARELALVVEDQDAGRFLHWTVLRIGPSESSFPEDRVPAGTIETENSFGKQGWGPPCPPHGDAPHRYVFALFALRAPSGLDATASPDDVRKKLAADALARGTLTGRFGRD